MEFPVSIVLGFFRICLLILFLYYMNRKFINPARSNNFLDFLVRNWFKYGSIIGLVIFGTIQLGIYNLINCLIILIVIIIIDIIGFSNFFHLKKYIETNTKAQVHQILRDIERKRPVKSWLGLAKRSRNRENTFLFTIVVLLSFITFGTRFFFLKYDLYSLSGTWLTNLIQYGAFDSQIWFGSEVGANADLAFANFYGKLADMSAEIALQSMGMLESTLLSIIIFWTVRKISPSKFYAPIVASITFALGYTLRPINVYFLLENKPILLALSFGLPAMVYLLRPGLLRMSKRGFFFCMLSAFTVMGLIDLFTVFILMPPFFVLAVLFTRSKTLRYFWIGMLAYLAAIVVLTGIYGISSIIHDNDLLMFLHSGLLSIGSYTYVPQLLLPFEDLVRFYQISSAIGLVFVLYFNFVKKERWGYTAAFLVYFNVVTFMGSLNSSWIDSDLMNLALSVFIPVMAGIQVSILVRLFLPLQDKLILLHKPAILTLIVGLLFCAFYFQRDTLKRLTEADTTPKQILDAYDEIATDYFPYSYAVVNDNVLQPISSGKHFFISYDDFINEYPKRDSTYFKHSRDAKFMRKNPDVVIPKSILLFVYSKDKPQMYGDIGDVSDKLQSQIGMLRSRGRKVALFYNNKNVKVYEIVNEPGESKISDLIF